MNDSPNDLKSLYGFFVLLLFLNYCSQQDYYYDNIPVTAVNVVTFRHQFKKALSCKELFTRYELWQQLQRGAKIHNV